MATYTTAAADDNLKGDDKILAEAKTRYTICQDNDTKLRSDSSDDIKFFVGEQWSSTALEERAADRRPALTINKLPAVCQQVVNSIRRNRPAIKVRAVDSATDPKTAELINGMTRNIMASNDVKSAMDTALEYAVICGQGYFRIHTDYVDPESFDQEIMVSRIDNPLSVYIPFHLCHEADLSDMPYAFIRFSMSKDEFKEKYGEKAQNDLQEWEDGGEGDSNWVEEDVVWLAEYFCIKEESKTLYQLSDGSTTFDKDEIEQQTEQYDQMGNLIPPLTIVAERETVAKKTMWYLMSGSTILESKEFPSPYIPIIPVLGWEINVDGRKELLSLIRQAKDPQRHYNFYKSMEAEIISLSPKTPWLAALGQLEGFEDKWAMANVKNFSVLEYNPIDAAGQQVAPPRRIDPPAIPSAAINAMRESADDIKAVTGIHDASMGAQGNESSGRAIIARQKMGDNATWHFQDSLTRAVKLMGRIIVDLIPKIYDVPRAIRILGEDEVDSIVMVNQLHFDEEDGENKLYDMTVGKYDVTVDVGPSYESKRMEVAENLTNIIQAIPNMGQVASDILVRNLDFPGASELADRLKRTIPPNLLEDPNSKPNKISEEEVRMIIQDLQGLQQQLQLAGQEKEQLIGTIKRYETLLKSKELESRTKLQTESMRNQTAIQTQRMKLMQEKMKNDQEDEMKMIDTAMKMTDSRSGPARPNLSDRYEQGPAPMAE